MTTILGYDPGGNSGHAVAALSVDDLLDFHLFIIDRKKTGQNHPLCTSFIKNRSNPPGNCNFGY